MADVEAVRATLAALAAYPAALRQQVAGLSEEALRFRPAADAWSVVENIGHLIDIDAVMAGRVGQMVSRDNPTLQAIDVDEAVRAGDYQRKHAPFLLSTFAERRAALVEEWRYLQAPGLARTGQHPSRGSVTVADMIATVARNDEAHREQIAATLAAFRASKS